MGKTISLFNRTVWDIVTQVPGGKVTTYGQIASMIPAPDDIDEADYEKQAPRWVGAAMEAVSGVDNKNVPWWRVINSKGGISLPEDRKAGQQQRARLKEEGIEFNGAGLVDFGKYGWEGPEYSWLKEHGLYPPKSLYEPPSFDNPLQLPLF